jgi:hypothetical protein
VDPPLDPPGALVEPAADADAVVDVEPGGRLHNRAVFTLRCCRKRHCTSSNSTVPWPQPASTNSRKISAAMATTNRIVFSRIQAVSLAQAGDVHAELLQYPALRFAEPDGRWPGVDQKHEERHQSGRNYRQFPFYPFHHLFFFGLSRGRVGSVLPGQMSLTSTPT